MELIKEKLFNRSKTNWPIDNIYETLYCMNNFKQSKTFCILPWIHARINQDGQVYPCCKMDQTYSYGSLLNSNFEEIMNNKEIKLIRQQMLNLEEIPFCQGCYNTELNGSASYRSNMNDKYGSLIEKSIKNTIADGTVKNLEIKSIDLRISNVCNFSCRSCGPQNSTSWYEDASKINPQFKASAFKVDFDSLKIFKSLNNQLASLDTFYFAGGEPLNDKKHYDFLKYLIQENKTDVELIYNTNFSNLSLNNENIIDLWIKFKKISLGLSLDAIEEQFELLRKGGNWKKIIENFNHIKQNNKIFIYVNPTVSILNAFHITDAIKKFIELGMIVTPDQIVIEVATDPDYISLDGLILEEREKIKIIYQDLINELHLSQIIKRETILKIELELSKILAVFSNEVDLAKRKKLKDYTWKLDNIRHEKTILLFPEYIDLLTE